MGIIFGSSVNSRHRLQWPYVTAYPTNGFPNPCSSAGMPSHADMKDLPLRETLLSEA